LALYRSGALAAPTSGTLTLRGSSGSDLLTSQAVTITGSIATYPIPVATLPTTLPLGSGYIELWTLACADGVTRTFRRDASLVLYAAYPVVTDADLLAVYSDLDRHLDSGTTTFQEYIDEAWRRILGRLESQGVFPDHVVTSWSLREVHVELALHLVCLDFGRAQGGRWMDLSAAHKKEFEMAWGRLRFVRASGSTGNADGDGIKPAAKGVTHLNQSPRSTWRGSWGM
jgi:hypothetical protein